MKINCIILFLTHFLTRWRIKSLYVYLLLILFSVMIFMLASKSGIIVYAVLMISYILRFGREKSFRRIIYFILIPFFIIVMVFLARRIDRIEWFIHYTKAEIISEDNDLKNMDQRTREWYSAIQLIKEKPLAGFGLSKVEGRMIEEYRKHGFMEEAHNQFLESQMTFGIFGILSLLWMLLTPVWFRKETMYPQLIPSFIITISFFLLFESMFNRQWGIMFFLLFYFIISIRLKTDLDEIG
jgi:O-antigen ligase